MYKTEEVRVLENQETLTNKFLKTVLPSAYCMDEKESKQLEGAKETVGAGLSVTTAANPVVGGVAAGASAGVGAVMEGVGKLTGNEGVEKAGNVYKEAPVQPLKEIKKVFE